MTADDTKEFINFLGLDRAQLTALFLELGEKPYRAEQMMKWMHHRQVSDVDDMTDMSKKLRARLSEMGSVYEAPVEESFESVDGTRKWLVRAASGSLVETVFIPESSRGTLCVSSQVGCALDCSFCSTGKQGFNSNLTAGEIVGQVRMANRLLADVYPERAQAVTNVVMMGMGEPLLNFDNVASAVDIMMDDLGYGISKRKVTISTAGVVPGIEKLIETTDCSLALSLHAPNDALRDELVPINRRYNIETLLDAARRYVGNLGDKRTITVEYTVIDKVNDQPEHAEELATLLKSLPCKINLIPFNPFPGSGYRRPASINIRRFQDRLVRAGHSVTVRTTRGEDIEAACGQLRGQVADKTRRQEQYRMIASEAKAEA